MELVADNYESQDLSDVFVLSRTLHLTCRLVYITYPIGAYHSHATHPTVSARLSHICLRMCSWSIIAINR
jgi:hypothetical protein